LDNIKRVICEALNEARESGAFLIFASVIMPDHLHLLTNQPKTSADVLRYLKGITARRTIDYLRQNNFQSSLAKLQHESWKREHKYSLWQKEKNVFSIYSEAMFMQKVNYIHLNPVRARLVERAVDYRWSSTRIWQKCPTEDEPLNVDLNQSLGEVGAAQSVNTSFRKVRDLPHIRRQSRDGACSNLLSNTSVHRRAELRCPGLFNISPAQLAQSHVE